MAEGQMEPSEAHITENGVETSSPPKPEPKFWVKLKEDAKYRGKVLHSFSIAGMFFSLGMAIGQNGPTFLDLLIITDVHVDKGSAYLSIGFVGYLLGAITNGAVHKKMLSIYKRDVNKNALLFLTIVLFGCFTLATPFCNSFGSMILMRLLCGMCGGLIDAGGNAEHMRIWGKDGEVLLQLLHFAFAFGGVMSPLMAEPFLAPRINETTSLPAGTNDSHFTYDTNSTGANQTHGFGDVERTTDVRYAFFITAACIFASAIPFFILYLKHKKDKEQGRTPEEVIKQRELPLPLYAFILIVLCTFFMLYCAVEDTFAAYLMTFLVTEFDFISKSQGAYSTSIYWGSFAASRFLMIFISHLMTPVKLLTACFFVMLLAYAGFNVAATYSSIIGMNIFAALAGLGMSAVFPSGFSWTEIEVMKVTGVVSSCILVSSSCMTMLNPLVVGYLIQEVSPMWFCYLLLAQTVIMVTVFMIVLTFVRCYVAKRYGPLEQSEVQEGENVAQAETFMLQTEEI